MRTTPSISRELSSKDDLGLSGLGKMAEALPRPREEPEVGPERRRGKDGRGLAEARYCVGGHGTKKEESAAREQKG
eukprot:293684-Rhodomonas_salina.1